MKILAVIVVAIVAVLTVFVAKNKKAQNQMSKAHKLQWMRNRREVLNQAK